jgi:NADH-quinone oxidoreductase subunit A
VDTEAAALTLYILFVVSVPTAVVILSYFLGPRRRSPDKLTPYECGVPLLQDVPDVIRVRFYMIAILFLLFDVEAALLIGWAVVHRSLAAEPGMGIVLFVEVFLFLALLTLGLIYGIRKGALKWD